MRGRGLRLGVIGWRLGFFLAASLGIAAIGNTAASADTLEWALVQAYQNNPSLNAQRAALRAVDENVPQALSGYRPKLSVTASGGYNYESVLSHSVNQQVFPNSVSYNNVATNFHQCNRDADALQRIPNR
jgi:outer membrane protein TolC